MSDEREKAWTAACGPYDTTVYERRFFDAGYRAGQSSREAAEAERDSARECNDQAIKERDEWHRQYDLLLSRSVEEERAAETEIERLRPCLENALQAMSSVAGRLRVEAKADDPDMEAIERDGNLLAALCPPTRAALSPREDEEAIKVGQEWQHHSGIYTVKAFDTMGGVVLRGPEHKIIRVWPDYFRENFTRVAPRESDRGE